MNARWLISAWTTTILASAATTVMRLRRDDTIEPHQLSVPPVVGSSSTSPRSDVPKFAERDPFRVANRPARVRYGVAPDEELRIAVGIARERRPVMTLRAIAGGPPWQALIDGFPGNDQPTLVRVGMTVDNISVRTITRETVVLHGADTTWVLTFARRQ